MHATEPGLRSSAGESAEAARLRLSDDFLWRALGNLDDVGAFCRHWLELQCRLVPAVSHAVLVLKSDSGYAAVAVWPSAAPPREDLLGLATRAVAERRELLIRPEAGAPTSETLLALPIDPTGTPLGALVCVLADASSARSDAGRALYWGLGRLEHALAATEARAATEGRERVASALDALAVALEHERFGANVRAFVTQLAAALAMDYVALAFCEKGFARVVALSGVSDPQVRMSLLRAMGAAVDEALDQRALLCWPELDSASPRALLAHREVSQLLDGATICTVPIYRDGLPLGGLLVVRSASAPRIGRREVSLIEAIGPLAGPVLWAQSKAERGVLRHAWESCVAAVQLVRSSDSLTAKVGVGIAALLAVFLALPIFQFNVKAESRLEGTIQRAVAAPFAGYVKSASVRAGDVVEEGALLAELDDRDLGLELEKWTSRELQVRQRLRQSSAAGDRPARAQALAQLEQVRAERALIDQKVGRTRLYAAFDAIVVRGDLSQSLGRPVEKGEVLFEIAPLSSYRLRLEIDERDVGYVQVGQSGSVVLASLVGSAFDLKVTRLTPVSEVRDGRNRFVAEAVLDEPNATLRPGMEGVAKIDAGRRALGWILARRALDWLRLAAWRWLP